MSTHRASPTMPDSPAISECLPEAYGKSGVRPHIGGDLATRTGKLIAAWFHARRVESRKRGLAQYRSILAAHFQVEVLSDAELEFVIYGNVITQEDHEHASRLTI